MENAKSEFYYLNNKVLIIKKYHIKLDVADYRQARTYYSPTAYLSIPEDPLETIRLFSEGKTQDLLQFLLHSPTSKE